MELIPGFRVGWLNGWILSCLLLLAYGAFVRTLAKDARSALRPPVLAGAMAL